jgi:arginyl-tRNA--protein-N-Asp/Glu arginylyltransferase
MTWWQRLVLRFTPHAQGRHEPDMWFGFWTEGCRTLMYKHQWKCAPHCRHAARRLKYLVPKAKALKTRYFVGTDWNT